MNQQSNSHNSQNNLYKNGSAGIANSATLGSADGFAKKYASVEERVLALEALNIKAWQLLKNIGTSKTNTTTNENGLNDVHIGVAVRSLLNDFGLAKFSTSLGMEDQLLTHFLFAKEDEQLAKEDSKNSSTKNSMAKQRKLIQLFTLDTGRLFSETYNLLAKTEDSYGIKIDVLFPATSDIENFVQNNGINGFYNSEAVRKRCCYVRKVLPLQRAIAGADIWITGLRKQQSPHRSDLNFFEWDEGSGVVKFHPLLLLSTSAVQQLVQRYNVPVSPLHAKGFVSIGCAPCTRALKPGEDSRAGRWWWEDANKKECGLHIN